MDIDREAAEEFERRFSAAFTQLFAMMEELRPRLAKEDFRILASSVCEAMYELDSGVNHVIYRKYPDLRPVYEDDEDGPPGIAEPGG